MLICLHESSIELICSYLGAVDCILLGQTCQRFYELLHSATFWPCVTLHNGLPSWPRLYAWHRRHLLQIQPSKLQFIITNHTPPSQIKNMMSLFKGLKSVTELFIWVGWGGEESVQTILNTAFQEMSLKSLTTTVFSENPDLIKNMKQLERLYLIGQDICFTGLSLAEMPCLRALVLKPHELDFGELTKFVKRSSKILDELQVDCENYPPELFVQMMCSLCPQTLRKLRLYHLENINQECFTNLSKVANLQQLIITKAYQISNDIYNLVFGKISWPYLVRLDITESVFIEDGPIIQLVKKSPRLKSVKLAWCGRITSNAVRFIVENCLSIEELVLTGVKLLLDDGFPELKAILPYFKREQFLDVKHSTMNLADFDKNTLFTKPNLLASVKCLRNLCILDCVSCDAVSNQIFEVLSLLRPTATILDYYSNKVGLRVKDDFEFDD